MKPWITHNSSYSELVKTSIPHVCANFQMNDLNSQPLYSIFRISAIIKILRIGYQADLPTWGKEKASGKDGKRR